MKNGWWVLLDEVNLAEPQILERINSVLETDPGLALIAPAWSGSLTNMHIHN